MHSSKSQSGVDLDTGMCLKYRHIHANTYIYVPIQASYELPLQYTCTNKRHIYQVMQRAPGSRSMSQQLRIEVPVLLA